MTGTFIALEGGEGGGKSTQAALLVSHLRSVGLDVVQTREPGATTLGAKVRALLLDPESDIDPVAEALLYGADRAQHVARVIRPALERGAVVVTDRYTDSTTAYQGAGRGSDTSIITRVHSVATGGLVPHLTLVLDLPVDAGMERARCRGELDRMELAGSAFHARVRRSFLDLAAREPWRYEVVDATRSVEDVAAAIKVAVEACIAGREVPAGETG